MAAESSPPGTSRERLPRRVLAALAGPSIPLAAFGLPLAVYVPSYYSGYLGLDLAAVGTTFMVIRLLDIAVDPVLGSLMDRTRTRLGRYRPWLLLAGPMTMLSIGLLMMAPMGVGIGYLAACLVFAYAAWSVLGLAQLAMAANISPDYHERSRVYGWWQVFYMSGMLLTLLLPKILAMAGMSSPAQGMAGMAWVVIIATPLCILPLVLTVKERPVASTTHSVGIGEYVKLLRRGLVLRVLAADALLGIAAGGLSTLFLFFFTSVKHVGHSDIGVLLIGNSLAGLLATPCWSWLANRIGKHRALTVSSLLFVCAQIALLFSPVGNLMAASLILAVGGLTFGATHLLPRAMLADVADQIRLETGADRTGMLFALLMGIWKIGQAVSIGVMFILLDLVGFSAAPGVSNPPAALHGLTLLFVGMPALLSFCAAITIFGFPLTAQRHAAIRKQLEARDAHADPAANAGAGAAARAATTGQLEPT